MMKKCVAVFLPVCLALLLGGAARASWPSSQQEEPPLPPSVVVVAQFLQFSESQATQFGGLVSGLLQTLRGLEEQKQVRARQLGELVNSPTPDVQAIGLAFLSLHALDQQRLRAIRNFQERFSALLTSEQQQRVQAVAQAAQLQPAVQAFASLFLVWPPQPAPPAPPPH